MSILETMWTDYVSSCYPTLSNDCVQYVEMRRAFYAGLVSMFSHLVELPDGKDEVTEADLAAMDNIEGEINAWVATEFNKMGMTN